MPKFQRKIITTPGSDTEVGFVIQTSGSVVPSGYLRCDGSAVSRTSYVKLFSIIGTIYGEGDGSTTFNVPMMTETGCFSIIRYE